MCGMLTPTTMPPASIVAGSRRSSVSSTSTGVPEAPRRVAAASTKSQRGVMTARPNEMSLGLTRMDAHCAINLGCGLRDRPASRQQRRGGSRGISSRYSFVARRYRAVEAHDCSQLHTWSCGTLDNAGRRRPTCGPHPNPMRRTKRRPRIPRLPRFDAQEFLDSAGLKRTLVRYAGAASIFSQGDSAETVYYIHDGAVRLSVLSNTGQEARPIAILGPGDFFGRGLPSLGQQIRMGTATAIAPSTILAIQKAQMIRVLHEESGLSDMFLAHVLSRIHPHRGRPRRSAFQFEGAAAGARCCSWRGDGKTTTSPCGRFPSCRQETLAGIRRDDLFAFACELLHGFKFRSSSSSSTTRSIKIHKSLLSVVLHE